MWTVSAFGVDLVFDSRLDDTSLQQRLLFGDRATRLLVGTQTELEALGSDGADGAVADYFTIGFRSPLFLFGPLQLTGLQRLAGNPLGFGARSSVHDETGAVRLDIDIGRHSRHGAVLRVPFGSGGFGGNVSADSAERGDGLLEVGIYRRGHDVMLALATLPLLANLQLELMGTAATPDAAQRDERWFADRLYFPGGGLVNGALRLASAADGWRLDGTALVSGGERIPTRPVVLLSGGYRDPRIEAGLLAGWGAPGYFTPSATPIREWLHLNTFARLRPLSLLSIGAVADLTVDHPPLLTDLRSAPLEILLALDGDLRLPLTVDVDSGRSGSGSEFGIKLNNQLRHRVDPQMQPKWLYRLQLDMHLDVGWLLLSPNYRLDLERAYTAGMHRFGLAVELHGGPLTLVAVARLGLRPAPYRLPQLEGYVRATLHVAPLELFARLALDANFSKIMQTPLAELLEWQIGLSLGGKLPAAAAPLDASRPDDR